MRNLMKTSLKQKSLFSYFPNNTLINLNTIFLKLYSQSNELCINT